MANEEKTPVASNNSGNVIGWLERILKLQKDYGVGKILSSIMLLFITIIVGLFAFNPKLIVSEIQRIQASQHQIAVEKRIKSDPQIREALLELRVALNADRVFIVEAHNGGSNLTSLPFLYVDMTYESVRSGMPFLEDEYKNVRLQRYGFCTFLYNSNYWSGDIEQLQEVDPVFYYRIKGDGVNHFTIMALYGESTVIGALGIEYCESEPLDNESISRAVQKYGNKFAILLNNAAPLK